MALYEFKCVNSQCEVTTFDEFMPMDGEHKAICPKCGSKANRVFNFGTHIVTFQAGFDHGLGEYVGTKKERDGLLQKYGLVRKE